MTLAFVQKKPLEKVSFQEGTTFILGSVDGVSVYCYIIRSIDYILVMCILIIINHVYY